MITKSFSAARDRTWANLSKVAQQHCAAAQKKKYHNPKHLSSQSLSLQSKEKNGGCGGQVCVSDRLAERVKANESSAWCGLFSMMASLEYRATAAEPVSALPPPCPPRLSALCFSDACEFCILVGHKRFLLSFCGCKPICDAGEGG